MHTFVWPWPYFKDAIWHRKVKLHHNSNIRLSLSCPLSWLIEGWPNTLWFALKEVQRQVKLHDIDPLYIVFWRALPMYVPSNIFVSFWTSPPVKYQDKFFKLPYLRKPICDIVFCVRTFWVLCLDLVTPVFWILSFMFLCLDLTVLV